MRRVLNIVAAIVLTALAIDAGASAVSDRMNRLLQEGKMLEVYRLGLKHSFEEAGNVEFDFAFGIAAVRVGRPGRAIFALERVLWLQPANHRARLELARAQFDLGNLGAARDEFREVLEHNPPENVRKNVETYLASIKEREKANKSRFKMSLEAGYVYDSNVNAATSDTQVAVPALGWVSLDSASTAQSGNVVLVNGDIEFEKLMSKRSAFFGSVAGAIRSVTEYSSLNTTSVDLRGGLMFGDRRSRFRIPVQVSQLYLNGTDYRQMAFMGLDWTRMVSQKNSIQTFLQGGTMQYPTQSARNVSLTVFGAAWSRRFGKQGHNFSLSAHYGQEVAQNSAYPWWSRSYYGGRADLQWRLGATDSLYANLSYQQAQHGAADPVFIKTRQDQLMQLAAGWSRMVKKKLLLKAETTLTQNDTNISLYTYNRNQLMLSAKYEF